MSRRCAWSFERGKHHVKRCAGPFPCWVNRGFARLVWCLNRLRRSGGVGYYYHYASHGYGRRKEPIPAVTVATVIRQARSRRQRRLEPSGSYRPLGLAECVTQVCLSAHPRCVVSPEHASPANTQIRRDIQLNRLYLKWKIDQRMHRHSREGYDSQRLHHASSRHPVLRGIPVITKNSDGYSAEKEQRPEAASQPSPFQHSLQIILV